MNKRILAIIPAYNEEANLERTLAPFLGNDPVCDYIVVNDGSADGTRQLCRARGFRTIDLPVNLGLTYAVKAGMMYAYEHGYDYAVQFDADGQHDYRYIHALYDEAQRSGCDIAIGTRFLTRQPPFSMRMLGSRLLSFLIRVCSGQRLTDPTSGMRLYNKRMIALYAKQPNINPEPDTIAYLLRCGITVREIQVEMHERMSGKSMFSIGASVDYMIHTAFSIVFIQWFRKRELQL